MALVPDVVKKLVSAGWMVRIQSGAGHEAAFKDSAYTEAGGATAPDGPSSVAGAGLVVQVNSPSVEQVATLPQGVATLSFFGVAQSEDALRALAAKKATVFSFDLLPRISRAQGMDALSSQGTVSGYRAGLSAAEHLAKFFPMFMTAAGTVPPAKVLVMGVGVAGLQSIATARRLGAVVKAYDVRAAAKEEAESLGATFLDLGVSAEGAGGYARELSPEELERQRAGAGRGGRPLRRRHHHRGRAGAQGARAGVHLDGRRHGRGRRRGRHGGGPGRQLRADRGRRGGAPQRRIGGRHGQPALGHAHPRQLPLRPQCGQRARIDGPEGTLAPDWDDEIVAGMCVLREGQPMAPAAVELLGAAGRGAAS